MIDQSGRQGTRLAAHLKYMVHWMCNLVSGITSVWVPLSCSRNLAFFWKVCCFDSILILCMFCITLYIVVDSPRMSTRKNCPDDRGWSTISLSQIKRDFPKSTNSAGVRSTIEDMWLVFCYINLALVVVVKLSHGVFFIYINVLVRNYALETR